LVPTLVIREGRRIEPGKQLLRDVCDAGLSAAAEWCHQLWPSHV